MLSGHGGRNLGCQIVQLQGGDARIKAIDDLECNCWRINIVHIKPIAELLDSRRNLVEVDGLLAAIPLLDIHTAALATILDHLDKSFGIL